MNEIKLFNKYSFLGITVVDPGLKPYINLKQILIPRNLGRHSYKKFWKTKMSVVERLINKLMVPGHKRKRHFWTSKNCSGKAHTTYNIVKEVFEIIENKTKKNPIQVLVNAIQKASPCEEITTIEYGGIKQPKAVENNDMSLNNLWGYKVLIQGQQQ